MLCSSILRSAEKAIDPAASSDSYPTECFYKKEFSRRYPGEGFRAHCSSKEDGEQDNANAVIEEAFSAHDRLEVRRQS